MMIFIIETKLRKKKKMEAIPNTISFSGLFVVDSVGRSGGLALLWCGGIEVSIQNYSRRDINATVKFDGVE